MKKYSYLALGDSYTIGEAVVAEQNFPSQTVKLLNEPAVVDENSRQGFAEPVIIAKIGWTTDELDVAIDEAGISKTFDIATLLIGVNNQYRGRSVNEYKTQFGHLLQRAIHFAGNKTEHVFVLSIPDWGITPFAEGQDCEKISKAIDGYNSTAREICEQHKIIFIDITTAQRFDGNKPGYITTDGLHPSGKEYAKWAKQLAAAIKKQLVI